MNTQAKPPSRLHHTAYVSRDLEATRRFYEDLIGLPLVATWCESDELFGAVRTYCHTFFELGDGSALAFFQFEKPEDQKLFGPELTPSPFRHIALNVDRETQNGIEQRLRAAGYSEPGMYVLEHGYCRSLYVEDPNGMLVEFTYDSPEAMTPEITRTRRANARRELARWLAGDVTSNNVFR
ncbi:VOC family protein [Archangium lansingense]|uniref:VOC family protein n=1 Tax=Archangium lansingense TaxID=2995310 RepID=A0ABT4A3R9_9BACT|nr:VOC family protein [Archangium lansinium]MCY1075624.1 VOC family protein [Archangium lansinium]